jgi:hypothetical protein
VFSEVGNVFVHVPLDELRDSKSLRFRDSLTRQMIEYYEVDAEAVTKSPDVADKLAKSMKR